MNCAQAHEQLERLALGALPDAQRAPLEDHLATCAACRAREAELRELVGEINKAGDAVSAGHEFRERPGPIALVVPGIDVTGNENTLDIAHRDRPLGKITSPAERRCNRHRQNIHEPRCIAFAGRDFHRNHPLVRNHGKAQSGFGRDQFYEYREIGHLIRFIRVGEHPCDINPLD